MKALSSKKSFSRRRKIIIFVVLLSLIGVGVSAYYVTQANQKAVEAEKARDRDRKAAETDKSAKKDAMSKDEDASSSEGLPENSSNITSEEVPTSSDLSIDITSTSQTDGTVRSSAQTNGSGTCVFQYTPGDGGKPVVSPNIAVSGNTCSFSRSQNDFTYLGSWTLKVTYYSGGKKVEASKNVTIN